MAKPRGLLSLVLLLILAAGVSIYALRGIWQEEIPSSEKAAPEVASPAAKPPDGGGVAVTSAPRVTEAVAAAPNPLARRFQSATDYLEFARDIHEAAKAGDAEAQYYLSRALRYCHSQFRAYFGLPGKSRSLEEGLLWAANGAPALDVDEARVVNDRCRSLQESAGVDFGDHDQWLQKAALGGQPKAQAALASELLSGANRLPADEASRSRQDARELVRQALASKDPEIIAEAGNLLSAIRQEDTGYAAAWLLAACARGLDCSSKGERMKELCRYDSNCQPYETVTDMARRLVPDFASAEQRAREINRLIDAGDWTALGFGEAPP